MEADANNKYPKVAVSKEAQKLIRHVAVATDAKIMDVVFVGVKLLQEKLGLPDPPIRKLPARE